MHAFDASKTYPDLQIQPDVHTDGVWSLCICILLQVLCFTGSQSVTSRCLLAWQTESSSVIGGYSRISSGVANRHSHTPPESVKNRTLRNITRSKFALQRLTYARAKLLSLVAWTDFSMIRFIFATSVYAGTLSDRDAFAIYV